MTCNLYVIDPIEFDVDNVFMENLHTDEYSEFDDAVAQAGGYSKGQRIISGDAILQSKIDENGFNPDGYTSDGNWEYRPSLKKKRYVPFFVFSKIYKTGDLVTMSSGAGERIFMYRSLQNNSIGHTPPIISGSPNEPDSDSYWEDVTVFDWKGWSTHYYVIPDWTNQDYTDGDIVWHATQGKAFEATQNITHVANDPTATEPHHIPDEPYKGDSNDWEFVEPINRLRLLDESAQTVTSGTSALRMIIDCNEPFTDLILLNMKGIKVDVIVQKDDDAANPVFDESFSLFKQQTNPYDFYFNHHAPQKNIHITGIPRLIKSKIIILFNLNTIAEESQIGSVIAGTRQKIGEVQPGIGRGAISYNDTDTNNLNKTEIIRGRKVKKAVYPTIIENDYYNNVVETLDSVTDKVCYYFVDNSHKELGVYGLLKDHNQVIPYNTYSLNNINVQAVY